MSIYTNRKPPLKDLSAAELRSYYATELKTCEDLMKMGYEQSGGVNIKQRAQRLENLIAPLDKKARGF
jgi:hypothetical protein